jgi:alpha-ketoglutarate-dependent 2,4-dichlorophenoxyacetate dioxygenase
MTIAISRRHPSFFAEIGGVDLTFPMTSSLFGEIHAVFNEYAVLLFRNQNVTDVQQVAFSALFGPVFTATKYAWRDEK